MDGPVRGRAQRDVRAVLPVDLSVVDPDGGRCDPPAAQAAIPGADPRRASRRSAGLRDDSAPPAEELERSAGLAAYHRGAGRCAAPSTALRCAHQRVLHISGHPRRRRRRCHPAGSGTAGHKPRVPGARRRSQGRARRHLPGPHRTRHGGCLRSAPPCESAAHAARAGNDAPWAGVDDMTLQVGRAESASTVPESWYQRSPEDICTALGVVPAAGLSKQRVTELLAHNGPNAMPEEKPRSPLLRFFDQYRSYMQIILVGAAAVSLAIREWSTAGILLLLTVFNALVGLRQEGKAESAMNALKKMMKATARVRRDGVESQLSADQVVVGDIVVVAAGDQVPADGRIIQATALQIDESALTGESTPAAKESTTLTADDLGPGDQTNMAFMNTPVTHGSATVVVTGTGAKTELGKISGMLSTTEKEQSPLTKELNRLTLWIAGAAGLTMLVMFVLGHSRGEAFDEIFVSAI